MFLKKLCYASASILMLALAHHLGASTATAQAPSNAVVCSVANGATPFSGGSNNQIVVTANGDVYASAQNNATMWMHVSNVFSGGATPATTESFGAIKAKYR